MRLFRFVMILALVASATAQEANLKLRDVAGAEHSLAEYRGKIVVLNFWATWCIPCKYEMPLLVQLHEKYEGQIVVIGASLDGDETQKRIPKFVEHHHVSFPVWTGATTVTLAGFGLEGVLPSTLF